MNKEKIELLKPKEFTTTVLFLNSVSEKELQEQLKSYYDNNLDELLALIKPFSSYNIIQNTEKDINATFKTPADLLKYKKCDVVATDKYIFIDQQNVVSINSLAVVLDDDFVTKATKIIAYLLKKFTINNAFCISHKDYGALSYLVERLPLFIQGK